MTRMLLAAAGSVAAIAFSASGLHAQSWSGSSHRSGAFTGVPEGSASFRGGFQRDCRGDRRCGNRGDRSDVVMDWYGGEWARWNNRTWEATSYNDWWHEEPSRAYPAWMRRNADCQRMWFSGDTLRC